MATTINVGQSLPLSIQYMDASGNILTGITPDTAPQWSDTTPATDTLIASSDGTTATALGVAAGDDTINLSLAVGGATFTASLALTVASVASPVASVQIIPGTPTP